MGKVAGRDQSTKPLFDAMRTKSTSMQMDPPLANNETCREHLHKLVVLARTIFVESAKREADSALGMFDTDEMKKSESLTRCLLQYSKLAESSNIEIGPEHQLPLAKFEELQRTLVNRGQLASIMWDITQSSALTETKETRTELTKGTMLLRDEEVEVAANRSGHVLIAIYRRLIALAAIGQQQVKVIQGKPSAWTKSTAGKVKIPTPGSRKMMTVVMYITWAILFRYFLMLVELSARISQHRLCEINKYYMKASNVAMDRYGYNVATALEEVTKTPPDHILGLNASDHEGIAKKKPGGQGGAKETGAAADAKKDSKEVIELKRRLSEQGRERAKNERNKTGNRVDVEDERRRDKGERRETARFDMDRGRGRSRSRSQERRVRTCHNFNNARGCDKRDCTFAHECEHCGGRHGRVDCKNKRS